MRLLALDFDGVISDSAPEAFVVALRTYLEQVPGSRFAGGESLPASGGAPPLAAVEGHPLYAGFLALMALGNRAEDYAVTLAALEQRAELSDQKAYDAFRSGQDPGWLRAYHKRFYRIRRALADEDPAGWRALIASYPTFVKMLRGWASEVIVAIATSKDRRSVGDLLRLYGLADLIPDDRVLDKEAGASKATHLEHLRRRFDLEFPEMAFLDDKVNHLEHVAPLGVRCGLACWGYNGEREIRLAQARGFLVCTLDDVEKQLFG